MASRGKSGKNGKNGKNGKKKRRAARGSGARRWSRRRRIVLATLVVLAVAFGLFALQVYVSVTSRFESRLWAQPATIYSAPASLSPGDPARVASLADRLGRSGYGEVDGAPSRPGQFRVLRDGIDVHFRASTAPGDDRPERRRTLRISRGTLRSIRDEDGRRLPVVTFEPEVLARVYGERHEEREVVAYEDLPETLRSAVLAAEDARFFEHRGVDVRAVFRAAWRNVRSGKIVQGGSTISQQTVKNLYLGHERTWWRKIRELPMALVLDLKYDKTRILEVYLNEVYLGQRGPVAVCGVQAASRLYFGRSVDALSVGESALLAGMIRSPGRYNPFVHPERAVERRGRVLDAMVRLGWIDEGVAGEARDEPLELGSGRAGFHQARHLADYVRQELQSTYSADELAAEGLRVYTTLDTGVQEVAERALEEELARLEKDVPRIRKQAAERTLQGAVIVTDPRTGAVLAMVGGRDYAETQFNRAVDARRQPGSVFKPFVYLAGFEAGVDGDTDRALTPATGLLDEPIEIDGPDGVWRPVNWDGEFRGEVSVRESLRRSLNVPTVRASQWVGLARVIAAANACGIESSMSPYPSLALGTQEVTPLELAVAYGTLANGGRRVAPRIVSEVRDASGTPLDRTELTIERAASPESTYLVSSILEGVFEEGGTAARARALGFAGRAAGKTGTTDDTRDAWFVGYTPQRVVLVWVGFDDGSPTGVGGASGALPVWVRVMREAPLPRHASGFEPPVRVVRRTIDPETGGLATGRCPRWFGEWFAEGTEPREECTLHGKRRRWWRDLFRRDRDREGTI